MIKSLSCLFVGILLPATLCAHGPGHIHRQTDVVSEEADLHAGHDHSKSGKSFHEPVLEKDNRWWGASLTTGWESRHVHYGVDETGTYGAYTTELSVTMGNFIFGAWSGFGVGNDYQEWDFTAGYNFDLGPVFFIPGYNFRYTPGIVEEGHAHEHEHEEAGHEEEGHEEHEEEAGHIHKTYGNELFAVLGTNKIPYVTPSAAFIWDLNNTPGAFLEFRLDGEIPVYKDIITLEPYALLGVNLGYNTRSYYGWNSFQFGLEANWQINKIISAFAGINYSLAMTALQDIDQGNEVWINVGLSFTY
ncbi:MAG: hypothetical protein ACOVMP_12050 [Chthoniobacterales bacterium]